ncbi:MAG: LacI family DNA-binding transcriptional regulator [Actinomycetota bacterium]
MEQQLKPRTISDLAELLGVSSMTIHRAIAGKPDIASSTRDRILAEIERLGWRPNIAARGLRQGKTFTLGILVSNVAASFLPEILQGVDRAAEDQGYHTFVSVHEHDPVRAERHLRSLESKGVDGIVYYPTESGAEGALLNGILRTIPVVTVMRPVQDFAGSCVQVDDRAGGEMAAGHLLDLGHRTLGFIGYRDSDFVAHRWAGFQNTVEAAGAEILPDCTVTDLAPGDDAARHAAARILSQPERPTALFCASDRLAARAMQAALVLGLRVPEDISILGYNGDPWGALLASPLTTVAQPRFEVGKQAARLVLSPSASDQQRVVLAPAMLRRASTARPPKVTSRTGILGGSEALRNWLAM